MRLKRFLIEKYGNIERADLAFDPSPGCINLLLAPNGAGKSVLRRAFHDLLFGIPLQSDMKFRFDYPGMHLLAHAVSAEGEEYAFGWQRKAGRSFPGADTNPGASRWLAELLAAVTPRQVEMLFALDTERLRIGGKELAASDGTVGAALLSGTGELASARALRKSLEARSAALWEKGKSKPPLNSALSRLNEATRLRRAEVQTVRTLVAQQAALEAMLARKHAADEAAQTAQARVSRLQRIELTRGPIEVLGAANTWLFDHPDTPRLPPELGADLAKVRHDASLASTRLIDARATLDAAAAHAREMARDELADTHETSLARLPGELGDAESKRDDIPKRIGERLSALAAIETGLRDLGLAIPPDRIAEIVPDLPAITAARELIRRDTVVTTKLQGARDRVAKADAALNALVSGEGDEAEPLPDRLEPLLVEIRRDRGPGGPRGGSGQIDPRGRGQGTGHPEARAGVDRNRT